MTEDDYLTVSNLAKMRVLIRGIGELFFMDEADAATRKEWEVGMWGLIAKYEKKLAKIKISG